MKKHEKEKGYQLLHKIDNGEIVLCSLDNNIIFVCKKCKQFFLLNIPYNIGMSDDFIEYKKEGK